MAEVQVIVRWCVQTDDRIGMVRDLVACIARFDGNVEAMEVVSGFMYVRLNGSRSKLPQMQIALTDIDGVQRIDQVESLPYEADEQNLAQRALTNCDSEDETAAFSGLIYESDAMRQLVRMARTMAVQDVPILITGESGTGKELMARAIHRASLRSQHRFVPVNCAAIPESLLDSELFGYVEGAFTGAKRGGRLGLFEVAHEGTLFLDEIGEMNSSVQAKLLRVLSEGELRRVGDSIPRQVNVRVIAATNRKLDEMVGTGQFRSDLYFRLNVIPIQIPALRDRKEDVLSLTYAFIETMEKRLQKPFHLTAEAKRDLLEYSFPGNVRELRNMVERACYLADGPALRTHFFMLDQKQLVSEETVAGASGTAAGGTGDAPQAAAGKGKAAVGNVGVDTVAAGKVVIGNVGVDTAAVNVEQLGEPSLPQRVKAFEQNIISQTIERTGSIRKAAKQLGVSHTTLINKLKRS